MAIGPCGIVSGRCGFPATPAHLLTGGLHHLFQVFHLVGLRIDLHDVLCDVCIRGVSIGRAHLAIYECEYIQLLYIYVCIHT